jgi:CxxC-x17-CxxC domain-containing protein
MADKMMTCRDCGNSFTFTEGEQAFYAQKGFTEPTRCPDCRAAKKAARNNSAYGDSSYGNMGNGGYSSGSGYNSYGNGNGGNYGNMGNGGYGGYSRPQRVMTQVTCANCGKETEVPFVPRGLRPVYCSDCFNQMNAGSSDMGRRY